MRELNTILTAINMSVLDDEVMKRAILMAKVASAQLHLIHAVDIPVLDIEITSKFFKQKIDTENIKKKIVQKLNMIAEFKNVESILHVTVGDADEQVMHIAKKIQADLIIVASHSKEKIEDYYLGSTVNNIAQKSGLPILVIKNSVDGDYKNILAPTDFSISSKKSILFAQKVFKSSVIELLFTYEELDDLTMEYYDLNSKDDNEHSEFLGRPHADIFKEDVGIKKLDMIKYSSSENETLLECIKTKKSDLVILGSGGSDIAGSFLGSTASYLLKNSPCDVLIYIPLNQEKNK